MRVIAAALLAIAFSFPAHADIKAFNAAVTSGDYAKAAAEAKSTWPTLDQTRKDIHVIAREFAYAAYIARDYPASITYAQFAAAQPAANDAEKYLVALADLLHRAADYRLKASAEKKAALVAAMNARAAYPGFDNITVLVVDLVVAEDFREADWNVARTNLAVALKMARAGGAPYKVIAWRLQLMSGIMEYMDTRAPAALSLLDDVRAELIAHMEGAESDAAAARTLPLYYEVTTWRRSMGVHVISSGKSPPPTRPDQAIAIGGRLSRLMDLHDPTDPCRPMLKFRKLPTYPKSARFNGFVGAVRMSVDIDDQGRASNPKVIAAIPDEGFGASVVKSIKDLQFSRRPEAPANCPSMGHTGHLFDVEFMMTR